MKLQKIKDGLIRSVWWNHTPLDCGLPDYRNSLRTLLARLNAWGLWHTSDVWLMPDGRMIRHFFHEPIPGWTPPGTVVRGRKKTLLTIRSLIRSDESRAVRFCRASKTRPCWTKNTAERRRDSDKRQPHEKHRLVVASPLGPQRFQKLCIDMVGRTIESGERLSRMEADALFVLNRPWKTHYIMADPSCSPEVRFIHSERDERRLERESWRIEPHPEPDYARQ